MLAVSELAVLELAGAARAGGRLDEEGVSRRTGGASEDSEGVVLVDSRLRACARKSRLGGGLQASLVPEGVELKRLRGGARAIACPGSPDLVIISSEDALESLD